MATLQDRIKNRRNSLGLTLLDVADMLGVKEATVQRYESGEIKNVKHETVVKLATILKCSPQYLMGWSDEVLEINSNSLSLNPDEDKLISNYRLLNDSGKEKLLEYSEDLIGNAKYTTPDFSDIKEKHA